MLSHGVSEVVLERLDEHLGRPSTCPHGNVIPGRRPPQGRPMVRLTDLPAGVESRVFRVSEVAEHDAPHLLAVLHDGGLIPEARILRPRPRRGSAQAGRRRPPGGGQRGRGGNCVGRSRRRIASILLSGRRGPAPGMAGGVASDRPVEEPVDQAALALADCAGRGRGGSRSASCAGSHRVITGRRSAGRNRSPVTTSRAALRHRHRSHHVPPRPARDVHRRSRGQPDRQQCANRGCVNHDPWVCIRNRAARLATTAAPAQGARFLSDGGTITVAAGGAGCRRRDHGELCPPAPDGRAHERILELHHPAASRRLDHGRPRVLRRHQRSDDGGDTRPGDGRGAGSRALRSPGRGSVGAASPSTSMEQCRGFAGPSSSALRRPEWQRARTGATSPMGRSSPSRSSPAPGTRTAAIG